MKNNNAPHGWWILPVILLGALFTCALLVALLLPHAYTSGGAFGTIAIAFAVALIGGFLALWMIR